MSITAAILVQKEKVIIFVFSGVSICETPNIVMQKQRWKDKLCFPVILEWHSTLACCLDSCAKYLEQLIKIKQNLTKP